MGEELLTKGIVDTLDVNVSSRTMSKKGERVVKHEFRILINTEDTDFIEALGDFMDNYAKNH